MSQLKRQLLALKALRLLLLLSTTAPTHTTENLSVVYLNLTSRDSCFLISFACTAARTDIAWQEQCSHSGKPIQFSSMIAPLAPLYNSVLRRQWDRRNVEFHQVHHERMRCNYSITQWFDHLVGTTRWQ